MVNKRNMRYRYYSLEKGIFFASPFARMYECVASKDDWCIMRGTITGGLKLAYVTRFGQVWSKTGAKFPNSPLGITIREIEPGIFEAAAELSDFQFLKCRHADRDVALRTVTDRVQKEITGGIPPVITSYSLFGASLEKFSGFKITGSAINLEGFSPASPDNRTPLPNPQRLAPC